jgi:site-specific recombinase XerD
VNASLHLSADPGITELADAYLAEFEHAGRSAHTLRAYRSEVARLASFHDGPVGDLDVHALRAFLATRATLSAASRARTHAALAGFLGWCYRHEHIDADPIAPHPTRPCRAARAARSRRRASPEDPRRHPARA